MEDDREQIHRWLDALYKKRRVITQLDAIGAAQVFDLPSSAMEIVNGLPPGRYPRAKLCDQLNSAIVGRGLSRALGTYE